MEKFIVIEFPPESVIPQELQTSDMLSQIQPFLAEILNWALLAPKELLLFHLKDSPT